MQGPRTARDHVVERLANKPDDYGSKKGELGAFVRYENRRKRFARWMPPTGPGPFPAENRVTLIRLLNAIAGRPNPGWPGRFPGVNLDTKPDLGLVHVLTNIKP